MTSQGGRGRRPESLSARLIGVPGSNAGALAATQRSAGVKRLMDFVLAAIGLVVFSPVLAILAVAVRLIHGSPVLFRQERAGLAGEPFVLVKLRTMTEARGPEGTLLPDEVRLTSFGQFLRSTSLDELPTLWNVIRGDMSLVGPRPLPMDYLQRYSDREARRHEVRPGVTGLAQVAGRNSLEWAERLELDVQYVESQSILGDIRILVRTIPKVAMRSGINAKDHATMAELRPPSR